MRLHATVSKDGYELWTRLHPSRRIALAKGATAMLLRMRSEFAIRAHARHQSKKPVPCVGGTGFTQRDASPGN